MTWHVRTYAFHSCHLINCSQPVASRAPAGPQCEPCSTHCSVEALRAVVVSLCATIIHKLKGPCLGIHTNLQGLSHALELNAWDCW